MVLFYFLLLMLDVHAIFYANTTVSTFSPSITASAIPAVPVPTPTPTSTSDTPIITVSAFAQSSSSSILNATATGPPHLITTTSGTSTITECPPIVLISNGLITQYPEYRSCCDYYNASGNVAAFDSWVTAGDDATSPYVGAKYGCCDVCVVRARNIQVYYWPDAANLMECYLVTTHFNTDGNPTLSSEWFDVSTTWVDPAFGCSGSAPTPVTTVISGRTLTSPAPGMGFTSVGAYDHCSQWWG